MEAPVGIVLHGTAA